MTVCSRPGCSSVAALQWARVATVGDAERHLEVLNGQRRAMVDARRATVLDVIDELQSRLSSLPVPDLEADPKDRDLEAEGRRRRIEARVAEERAALAAIGDAVLLTVEELGTVTVPVFGCEEHALDAEAAARLHGVDCGAPAERCGCP
jgi:hypothetical protein